MQQNSLALPVSNVRLNSAMLIGNVWAVWAEKIGAAVACLRSYVVSPARHSSAQRRFWDLPIQGRPLRMTLTVCRGQCRNADCEQSIFTERPPGMVDPRARQTRRPAGILRLLGHSVGRRPGKKLAARVGFAGSRTTILRHLIRHERLSDRSAPRVWWDSTNGHQGRVFASPRLRSTSSVGRDRRPARSLGCQHRAWLAKRPSIEPNAHDRDGHYADASRAPQAKQIADPFHT